MDKWAYLPSLPEAASRRQALQWLMASCAPAAWAQTPSPTQPQSPETTQANVAAASWPTSDVQLVVPFPAGGPSALLAKALAAAFQRHTQRSMRLDIRGGNGGLQGAAYAASLPADGKHLFIGGSHLIKAQALQAQQAQQNFDALKMLTPLGLIASVPQVVLVNPRQMKTRTAAEWLAELRRKHSPYRMGTAGKGSSSHLAAEVLRQQAQLRFEYVHFKGSGPALQDLMQGTVDTMVDSLASALPHIRNGRLRPLMVTGVQRSTVLPQVPSVHEMGIDGLEVVAWYGLFAPQNMGQRLAQAIIEQLQVLGRDPQLQEDFAEMGLLWPDVYGQDFMDMIHEHSVHWEQRFHDWDVRQILQPESGA